MTLRLKLKPGKERRIRGGHPWVYSNEVDVAATPLKGMAAGGIAVVEDSRGNSLGVATVSPNSLICARLYSRNPSQKLDGDFLRQRLQTAMTQREQVYPGGCYRLCYGDADSLPGVVVDRFGDYLAVRLATATMDQMQRQVIEVLVELTRPKGILLRNMGPFRQQEGLPESIDVAFGEVPEFVEIVENNTRFTVPLLAGQKTGWFYDHRENRALLQRLCPGKSVLDVFSYAGGWAVEALMAGAKSACCVDASAEALNAAAASAELNGVSDRFSCRQGKAAEILKALAAEKQRFDIVVLDPPAFIKRRKDIRQGEKAYHQINQLAMKVLAPGGLLVSASCSMHLSEAMLMDVVRQAGSRSGRQLQVIASGGAGLDHPVHPAIPETRYLKAIFAQEIVNGE
ncbi:class I SAM-dependent rRNA methyltransferase [Porticoccus sp. W117]|uniref:class I SAM-dependent rRNA methyltransferase n=1 Tax=Porticoccus sp. W117 TaxID=3054777 RepID=UPI002599C881|nr:class I SAM-dependent rRNA methyltransferase [Porticoccus sp. W117]MDM3872319.1 class I SAM-dependent rRNA methyltransferase [Porticoccus sp. W117]